MKKQVLLINLLIALCIYVIGNDAVKDKDNEMINTINVYCIKDMADLTTNLANQYISVYPNADIKVSQSDDLSEITGSSAIGIVPGNLLSTISNENLNKVVIARNIVVPVINSNNPLLEDIYKQGISKSSLAGILQGKDLNWKNLVDTKNSFPVHLYAINNKLVKSSFEDFLNIDFSNNKVVEFNDIQQFITTVQKDKYAIGFCKLNDITIKSSNEFISSIAILPLDQNDNGKLDYMEQIYSDKADFIKGAWIGKYPRSLFQNIFAVYSQPFNNEKVAEFLNWVCTAGQDYLDVCGYNELALNEQHSNIVKLETVQTTKISSGKIKTFPSQVLVLVISCISLLVIIDLIIRFLRKKRKTPIYLLDKPNGFNGENGLAPSGLFYDKSYTWTFMEKEGNAKVGIVDFLLRVTGKITQIKMKDIGEEIVKGKELFSITQDGKQLTIKSPISGKIVDRNEKLALRGSMINESPYDEGWVYSIQPSNWMQETQHLSMVKDYLEWLRKEFTRLKEFFSNALNINQAEASLVFQDGGLLKNGVLEDFGPQTWEEFQINFLDK